MGVFVVRDLNSKHGTFLHNEFEDNPFVWDSQEILEPDGFGNYLRTIGGYESVVVHTSDVVASQSQNLAPANDSWADSLNFYLEQDLRLSEEKEKCRHLTKW